MGKHHPLADTGRPGRAREGSMIWQVSRLKLGQSLLLTNPSEYRGIGGFMANVQQAIATSLKSGALPGDTYSVKVCIGHTYDLSEPPFKFLRVTRDA